jgi:hypothetical protein
MNKLSQSRVNQLVLEFKECLSHFESARIFSGPSVYFHRKTLAERAKYNNCEIRWRAKGSKKIPGCFQAGRVWPV